LTGLLIANSNSAISSTCSLTNSTNRVITRALRCGLNAAHSCWARAAEATAASTSLLLPIGTSACTWPVLGSNTSAVRPDCPAVRWPSMKWVICAVMDALGDAKRRKCGLLGHPSNESVRAYRPNGGYVARPLG
jgi:hypothetical protein